MRERVHGIDLGCWDTHRLDVPQLDVLTPHARCNSGASSHEVIVERTAVGRRIRVPDAGRPQVAREADVRLELVSLDILDQLAAGIELPVVRHPENTAQRVVGRGREIRRPARGDAPLVLLGPGERDEHLLKLVGVFGRLVELDTGFFEQVRAVHQHGADRRTLNRQGVDLAIDDARAPRVIVVVRQVGVVLDGITAQVWRQVGALGFDEARQPGDHAPGHIGRRVVNKVGQVIARNDHVDFGRVIRRRNLVHL